MQYDFDVILAGIAFGIVGAGIFVGVILGVFKLADMYADRKWRRENNIAKK